MSNETGEISSQERESLVKNHSFFSLLNDHDAQQLVQLMQQEVKNTGEAIVEEGDLVDKIYFIAEGKAEVTRQVSTVEKTSVMHISFLQKGDVIGLAQTGLFSTSGVRTAKVTALTPMILLSIKLSNFYSLSSSYPALKQIGEKFLLMNFIKQTPAFSHLDNDEIRQLAKQVKKISLAENTQIFPQNDIKKKYYFLLSGELTVTDKNNQMTVLQPGAFFEEAAIVNATIPCSLFELEKEIVTITLKQHKKFNQSLWKAIKGIFKKR